MGVWRVALLGREWESGTAVDTMQLDGNVDMDMLALYFGFDVSGSYVTCANCGRAWDRDDKVPITSAGQPNTWSIMAFDLLFSVDRRNK